MTQHHADHDHRRGGGHDHHRHAAALADLLDLDARVLGSYLTEAIAWVAGHLSGDPRRILDLGAGTGVGTLALARRFPVAEVVAVDRSAAMLGRVAASARDRGLGERVRTVEADLDVAWPDLAWPDLAWPDVAWPDVAWPDLVPGPAVPSGLAQPDVVPGPAAHADLVWASSALHEVADPARVLGDTRAALRPGGVLAVVELDALPRFLPDDAPSDAPGLESRAHDALAAAHWNAHPDWTPALERAGFQVVARRSFASESSPTPVAARYARAHLRMMRPALEDRLDLADLAALDRLLADEGPDSPLSGDRVVARGSRTVWIARRPAE